MRMRRRRYNRTEIPDAVRMKASACGRSPSSSSHPGVASSSPSSVIRHHGRQMLFNLNMCVSVQ